MAKKETAGEGMQFIQYVKSATLRMNQSSGFTPLNISRYGDQAGTQYIQGML